MGYSVNRVTLLGYVGKDPETKVIPSGTKVSNFSIATDESYLDKKTNQKIDKSEWHNLVAWAGTAEIAEKYVRKGSKLYVEGHLQTRSWDGQDGKKNYRTEIVIDQLILLGDKNGAAARTAQPGSPAPAARRVSSGPGLQDGDGLPF
jgi:single-strand DNA-binding protein